MEKSNETTRVLNDDLDDELFDAIDIQNNDAIDTQNNDKLLALLQRGANPNAVRGGRKETALLYVCKQESTMSES
jgi:hypothetical protein